MIFYVGRSFTATQTGKRTAIVYCDRCKTEYFYDLVRQSTGRASAPYYIGQRGAQRRAEKSAAKTLQKKLALDSELVPCPNGHWINDELIAGYRSMRLRWIRSTSLALGFVVFIISFVVWSVQDHREFAATWYLDLIYSALALLPILGIAGMLRAMLSRRINPNKNFPNPPRLLPGTPRGWTASQLVSAKSTDDGRYVPPAEADDVYPGWAVFRAGHLRLSPVCCECLAPATHFYKERFTVNDRNGALNVPLCKDCKSRLRLGWFLAAIGTIVGSFAVAFVGAMCLVNHTSDQLPLAVVFSIIFSVVGLAIMPNYFTKPYSLRLVDRDRAIYRIWFRNEQYTELVRDAARKIEERSFRPPVMAKLIEDHSR
jgi:hypothetical protein